MQNQGILAKNTEKHGIFAKIAAFDENHGPVISVFL